MVIERITLKRDRDGQTVVIELDDALRVVQSAYYGKVRIQRKTYPTLPTLERAQRGIESIIAVEMGWGFKKASREILVEGQLEKVTW